MEPDKLEEFRTILTDMLNALLEDADRTVADMNKERTSSPDPADRARMESDRNFELRIRDRERRLIGKIKEALQRIDDQEFGYCEECEEPIGEARLRARPVTTLCIDCKTEQERQERIGS